MLTKMKKIKFYTFSHKRPDFIKLQYYSMKNYLMDIDFEFIVFNNCNIENPNSEDSGMIRNICRESKITCIDIQKEESLINKLESINNEKIFKSDNGYSNSVVACAYPLCWAWKNYISKHDGMVCIIDSDIFFNSYTDTSKCFEKDLLYISQSREKVNEYMWNGLVFANIPNLPSPEDLNWWCGNINGSPVDVGGQTFYYLQNNIDKIKTGNIECYHVSSDDSCNFNPPNYEIIKLPGNEKHTLIHYRGGSNWNGMSKEYHENKTNWIKNKIYDGK